ncbi:MAG TPA: phenylalanine--tRNA ligase subunit beta [Bacteroidia bacterium]|nr:phenylalanine--tRNA ligase subunit beta [Bacteroidia bacterium]
MKISYNWLKEYINIDLPANEVAEMLTFCGLEVESIETFESIKGGLNGLVVGEVITKEKHPDADKLSLTKVNVGNDNLLQIVCGAPNVAAGQKVIVALVGAKLYPIEGESFEIKKSKIRGLVSEGMICAEDEIGVGLSHDGIMILPSDISVGMMAADYFKVEKDTVFEIGLTPNRVDASSHIGVARDLAAVLAIKTGKEVLLNIPKKNVQITSQTDVLIDVEILASDACPRYSGVYIEDVNVQDSPSWLKNKLLSIGVKPINNVVDITNYVLHETGQPLHAFDADAIKGNKILVKKPSKEEKFITLDGIERSISTHDLMICNNTEAMCIAGVYGGLYSGVKSATKRIFLESAYFDATCIRKTSKHHNLKTDASFRFERGTDPSATIDALYRAIELLTSITGAKVRGNVIDIYPNKFEPKVIEFDLKRCHQLVGAEIPEEQINLILKQLGIKILSKNDDLLTLQIPLNKVDVTREADVIEEILRIYGYNNIELPEQMRISLISKPKPNIEQINHKLRKILTGIGFHEILNNSLSNSTYAEKFLQANQLSVVKLLNPLSSELDSLRQSMLFGALETIRYNSNRKNSDLKLFETGKVYYKSDTQFHESTILSIVLCGNQYAEAWNSNREKENYFRLKGVLDIIFKHVGISPTASEIANEHTVSTGIQYHLNTKKIGFSGIVKNEITKAFDIQSEIFYAQLHLDELYKPISNQKIIFNEVPKFPEVRRDLALLIDEKIGFEQIIQIAKKSEKNLLKSIQLFDVYQGKNLEAGKKSYAVSFTLQDAEATLNDKQIDKVMSKLIKAYEEELGATLRS